MHVAPKRYAFVRTVEAVAEHTKSRSADPVTTYLNSMNAGFQARRAVRSRLLTEVLNLRRQERRIPADVYLERLESIAEQLRRV